MCFDQILEFFLNDDEDYDPAMELDLLAGGDPTTEPGNPEAQQQGGNVTANQNPPQQQPQPTGTQTLPQDNTTTDPGMDAGADTGDMDMGDDTGDDDFGDEDGDDGGMGDTDTNSGDPNDPEIDRKINLRKLINALIIAYDNSINAMTKAIPPSEDGLGTKYYNLQEKMLKAKDILYEIATRDIYTKPYEDSLRRYSALNQLYSICVEYLNTILIKKPVAKKKTSNTSSAFRNNVKVP